MLSKGWIKPNTSQYNHSILFAKKKDGTLRMCIDYRSINNNTVVNGYKLPRIDDIIDRLAGSMVYSKLDLATGYHYLAIKPTKTYRTVFVTQWGL